DREKRDRRGDRYEAADHTPRSEQSRLDSCLGESACRSSACRAAACGQDGEQRDDHTPGEHSCRGEPCIADRETTRSDSVLHEPACEYMRKLHPRPYPC